MYIGFLNQNQKKACPNARTQLYCGVEIQSRFLHLVIDKYTLNDERLLCYFLYRRVWSQVYWQQIKDQLKTLSPYSSYQSIHKISIIVRNEMLIFFIFLVCDNSVIMEYNILNILCLNLASAYQ